MSAPLAVYAQLNVGDPRICQGTGLNCEVRDANSLIRTVINWLLGITFGIAVLFLIIGGFQFLTAGASPDNATKGKQTIINALIGIVIIILSYVIVNVVANLVSNRSGSTAP